MVVMGAMIGCGPLTRLVEKKLFLSIFFNVIKARLALTFTPFLIQFSRFFFFFKSLKWVALFSTSRNVSVREIKSYRQQMEFSTIKKREKDIFTFLVSELPLGKMIFIFLSSSTYYYTTFAR